MLGEERELELVARQDVSLMGTPATMTPAVAVAAAEDRTFGGGREPEQGFYRVYDELDRVKEWHLTPYVLARKARMRQQQQEQEQVKQQQQQPDDDKKQVDKQSLKSEDSGRVSVTSSNKAASAAKSVNSSSDSGSNCSADSGTYNIYDEKQKEDEQDNIFLNKVSLQLDSCRAKRKRTPPPPPKSSSSENASALSSSPPPLPPRSKRREQDRQEQVPQWRRKDLGTFFGLLQDEPNQLLSKEVARSVAMRNLTSPPSGGGNGSNLLLPLKEAVVVLRQEKSPGCNKKKDLNRYLGIQEQDGKKKTAVVPAVQSGGGVSLLRCLGTSPNSLMLLQRSVRRLSSSPKKLEESPKARSESDMSLTSSCSVNARRTLNFEDAEALEGNRKDENKSSVNKKEEEVEKCRVSKGEESDHRSSQTKKLVKEEREEVANKSVQTSPPLAAAAAAAAATDAKSNNNCNNNVALVGGTPTNNRRMAKILQQFRTPRRAKHFKQKKHLKFKT